LRGAFAQLGRKQGGAAHQFRTIWWDIPRYRNGAGLLHCCSSLMPRRGGMNLQFTLRFPILNPLHKGGRRKEDMNIVQAIPRRYRLVPDTSRENHQPRPAYPDYHHLTAQERSTYRPVASLTFW
jgi:hypothetical protein